MKSRIIEYIDNNTKWLIDSLFALIAADTVNHPPFGNENNGQKIIEEIFKGMDLQIDRFSPDDVQEFKASEVYLKGRDYSNRDNAVGYIGKGEEHTLIFNGHIDVVPADASRWRVTKPFEPRLLDGKIYGLGALDMKGGIIASVYSLKAIIDLGIPINGKVIIESVVDEEFGGANGSLACVMKGYTGDFAIIPEPSYMDIDVSNLSSHVFDVIISGSTRADYLYKKASKTNAILLMSKLICVLKEYEEYLNSLKNNYRIYREIEKPINFLFSSVKAGEIGRDKTLCNPDVCKAVVYLLNYPEKNETIFKEELFSFLYQYPDIRDALKDGTIIFSGEGHRLIEGGELDLEKKENRDFIDRIIKNGRECINRDLKVSALTAGSDFFPFNNYGNTPVIIFGPGGDNVHAADEYVLLGDLIDLSKLFALAIYEYCCELFSF